MFAAALQEQKAGIDSRLRKYLQVAEVDKMTDISAFAQKLASLLSVL